MGSEVNIKISDVKAEDLLVVDEGFPCVCAGPVKVERDLSGDLYFACAEGRHYLDGQLDDDAETLIGIVSHRAAQPTNPTAQGDEQ